MPQDDVKKNTVATPDSAWTADQKKHELARALRSGREAMVAHARSYRYMMPNPGELDPVILGGVASQLQSPSGGGVSSATSVGAIGSMTKYDLRLERADLPNPWRDSILDLARQPFRSRVQLHGWDVELEGLDVVDDSGSIIGHIDGWVDDMDGEGRSIDQWAQEAFEDSLFDGVTFGFVDNDPRSFPDVGSRRAAGARPYCFRFKREHVRRITVEERHGLPPRLLQIVLFQPYGEQDVSDPNAWQDNAVDAFKVVTAATEDIDLDENAVEAFLAGGEAAPMRVVSTRVYIENDRHEWVEDLGRRGVIRPDNPQDELLEIPLAPLYVKRCAPYRGECPFLDTTWVQNAIWNHNSELSGLAREASLTRVHISGYELGDNPAMPMRPDAANSRFTHTPTPNSQLQVGEFKGTAAAMIMKLVQWKSDYIRQSHHRMATEKNTAPVTAREITLEGVHASSALEMWVIFQEQGWKQLLDWMALLGGHRKFGTVSIPHDFGLPNSGVERNQDLYLANAMYAGNYYREAVRAGDVDEKSFDIEVEIRLQGMRLAAEMGISERIVAGEIHLLWNLISLIKTGELPSMQDAKSGLMDSEDEEGDEIDTDAEDENTDEEGM